MAAGFPLGAKPQPPSTPATEADLTAHQRTVLAEADRIVRGALGQGVAPVFATVRQTGGALRTMMASKEFGTLAAATAALLEELAVQAGAGEIVASVLVTPLTVPGAEMRAIMFDLESRDGPRFNVVLPYFADPEGPDFGPMSYASGPPQFFRQN